MQRVAIVPEYQPFILKEYHYWTLLLNEQQRYLGRAVLWLARPGGMQRLSGLSSNELAEMRSICETYERILDQVRFCPDHMNYAMLGNYIHEHAGHGHVHIIPRYMVRENPPMFMGVTFEDDRWGKNCWPETPRPVAREVIDGLVALLREKLK